MEPFWKNLKAEALRQIRQLPDDCTMEDILDRIHLLECIVRGFRDIEAGRVVSQAEVEKRMGLWLGRNDRGK